MSPKIAEVIVAIKTAPAEISLAHFALGCCLSVNASTTASMAVLVSSKEITNPIKKMVNKKSCREIFKSSEVIITIIPIAKWNFKFGSSFKAVIIPEKAYLKESTLR